MESRVETGSSEPGGSNAPQWTVSNKLARLQGGFSLADDGRTLQVAYTVGNIGDYPLLVFDRGDALSVASGRQSAGGVGAPLVRLDGGDLTLSHVAQPLSNPAPTAPPSPLASQVLPGDEYRNRFTYTLPESPGQIQGGQVRRVRYCQGAIGIPEPLPESDRLQGGVWRVPNAFAGHQGTLCSPWYELATGTLADD